MWMGCCIKNIMELKKVMIVSEFIEVEGHFIDLGKVTNSYIDSGRIMLNFMGGNMLVLDNDELVGDVTGNVISGKSFKALAEYLKERFQAKKIGE